MGVEGVGAGDFVGGGDMGTGVWVAVGEVVTEAGERGEETSGRGAGGCWERLSWRVS